MLRVHDAVADLAGEGTNLWMAAVAKAEEHLRTWQDALPFGRPYSADEEPRPEEVEHLLEGVAGGLARLVDQVLGEHRVGHRRVAARVALRGVDLDADEAVAERLAQVREPLGGHEAIVREPQPEDAELGLGGHPGLHPARSSSLRYEAASRLLREAERQRRLRQDGRQHRRLRQHGQGEVAGEAHADDPHPGSAEALVLVASQGLRPLDDRAVLPVAQAENSFETQAGAMALIVLPGDISAPGTPKRWGTTAVHPSVTTRSAKSITFGVMPGISANTSTAGPSPLR